ncbi:ABC-F family ATP-binding cassette domain-containing protein [uncultured Imperialibacter sp.]|uniref:ribosomal protection-like ABC-F family protein n=1 Tax=uncultured Imperialibacter sp. TaxID=1672639 RepID=UPI0030DD5452|tara:strand:+ start:10464 stop:12059 length:1596 start_codon:yes stop_codon:yes gene_type:complete
MLILQDITYTHPNKDVLFSHLNLSINRHDKIALIGNNGEGKSVLMKIMAGGLEPSAGTVQSDAAPYYVPQLFGQFNDLTVAQALKVDGKIEALQQILEGSVTETNMAILDDDWSIEERCSEALTHWGLGNLPLNTSMGTLSGGQKTKVCLAGIAIHQPALVLLDEPSNHLDTGSRELLYQLVQSNALTLVVVSHDRQLLNLLDNVYELSRGKITMYGGNYEFYAEQKEIESQALQHDVNSKEKALRKAKEVEREAAERKQKQDARGKKKQQKAGMPKVMMNLMKDKAEKSTSRLKGVHTEKIGTISTALTALRKELPDRDAMKFGFDRSNLHKGKVLVEGKKLNYGYDEKALWEDGIDFRINSGDRIAIKGLNGSGKTTLIKLILGDTKPQSGTIYRTDNSAIYIDQDYSLIDNKLTVYEQAQLFNTSKPPLLEHEVKIRLARFLFSKEDWDKSCGVLSGGEKMRLMLCCLTISNQAPDIIVLDEPTNNLDIQNIEILTGAINEYEGTLLVVSHDSYFLEQVNVDREILLR